MNRDHGSLIRSTNIYFKSGTKTKILIFFLVAVNEVCHFKILFDSEDQCTL